MKYRDKRRVMVLKPCEADSCMVTVRPVNGSIVYDYGEYRLMRTEDGRWYRAEGERGYKPVAMKEPDPTNLKACIRLNHPFKRGLTLCSYSTRVYRRGLHGEEASATYEVEDGSALTVRRSEVGLEATIKLRNGLVESIANKAAYTLFGNECMREDQTFGTTDDDVWLLTRANLSLNEVEEIICRYRETGRWNR